MPWIAKALDGTMACHAEVHVSELHALRFLLSRLERISADSVVAHHASGVRGAMLRMVDKLENGRPVPGHEVRRLIESGYALLEKAAREKIQ